MAKVDFLGKGGAVDVEDAVFGAEVKRQIGRESCRERV